MKLVRHDVHFSSTSYSWEPYSASLWCHPRIPTRVILVFGEQIDIPKSVLLPIQVPTELLQNPQESSKWVSVQISVKKKRLGLPYWTMILAICLVEDVSIYLDRLTLKFWAVWEHLPSLPECMLIRRQLLVHHRKVLSQWHPWLLLQSFETQTSRAQWTLHRLQSRLLQCHLGVRFDLYTSENVGSNSAFLRWQMSINVAKWTSFLSLCASWITFCLLLTLSNCQAAIVSSFFHSLSTAAAHPEFSSLGASEEIGVPHYSGSLSCILCLQCGIRDFSVEMIPNVVSWTHEPPCWIRNSSLQCPESWSASLFLSCKALPPPLELPTLSSRFFVFFIFSIFQIDEINASQPSSIIELWLLVCPFLLFSLLSGLSNFAPNFRPHILRSGSCLNLCQSPPRTTYISLEVFLSIKWTSWILSKNLINFDSCPSFNNHRYVVLATHPDLYE